MKLSIISAMGSNRAIGLANDLPWYLPADLKRFKELTTGHHVIMGRRTYESVGEPLPERTNIVLTRQHDLEIEGVQIAHDFNEAIRLVTHEDEVFIAGGSEVYQLALERADRMYLTLIHHEFAADTYFPEYDLSLWELVEEERFEADEINQYSYTFLTYDRRESSLPYR